MQRFSWSKWRHKEKAAQAQLDGLYRLQAVAEFDPQGQLRMANQPFLDLFDYRLEDVQGQHHCVFVPEQNRESAAYQQFWDKLERGISQSGRFRHQTRHGEEIWLQTNYQPLCDSHGALMGVVAYATDITQQEQRRADAEGQLQAISKVQAIIEFDLQGYILDANSLFLAALGYQLDEVVGQHHSMFVRPEERQSPAYAEFWRHLASGQYQAGQYLRIGKNGRNVWIEASYNPILDAQGHAFKVVKYATDITRRFMAAQTLQVAVQSLTDNVQRASQANDLAQQAWRVAEQGGHTVQNVIGSMSAITASSRKISEIIGVMDRIAFQTNILALNAAVEAARAGTHGKGFAVVASEVRNLAQSSASAAREIKVLIQASVQEVERGASLVQSAGGTMTDIVTSSRRVSEIMGEVVEASQQQSSRLGDVTADLTSAAASAS